MNPSERDPQHLLDAVHYLGKAQGFLDQYDQSKFMLDAIAQLATAKVLEVALDACWKLTKEFKVHTPKSIGMPWEASGTSWSMTIAR